MSQRHDGNPTSWLSFVEGSAADSLAGFLRGFQPRPSETAAPIVPARADRWLLTSGLHKAVRLGLAAEATAIAGALHRADAAYLWRRLPVLALEEVSLGDLALCSMVVRIAKDAALRRQFGSEQLAAYLAGRLASALKCRSPCDLLSLLIAEHGEERFEARLASVDPASAADLVCRAGELPLKAAAWLRLDRLPIRGTNERGTVMAAISAQLRLPEQLRDLLLAGKSYYGLPVLLPPVLEVMRLLPPDEQTSDTATVDGMVESPILFSALDSHTRMGQQAIRVWATRTPELADFFAALGLAPRAVTILRTVLFHLEGSVLDRRLTNDALERLRLAAEQAELRLAGLHEEHFAPLSVLVRAHHAALNCIREELWNG